MQRRTFIQIATAAAVLPVPSIAAAAPVDTTIVLQGTHGFSVALTIEEVLYRSITGAEKPTTIGTIKLLNASGSDYSGTLFAGVKSGRLLVRMYSYDPPTRMAIPITIESDDPRLALIECLEADSAQCFYSGGWSGDDDCFISASLLTIPSVAP